VKVYFGSRPLDAALAAQKLLPVRALTSAPEEKIFERRAPWADAALKEDRIAFLFRYEIFPETVLRFRGEWQDQGRAMRAGDTIAQEAAMPPVSWGARLVFGARVTEIKRTPREATFSYCTLTSHAETGVNTFGLHLENGDIVARVLSRAEPGNPLMRLAGPVVMAYADWCKKKAVESILSRYLNG